MIKIFKLKIWTDFQSSVPDTVTTLNCPISITLISKNRIICRVCS